jgi:hypothetical protein
MDKKQISRKGTAALKRAGVKHFGDLWWHSRVLGDNFFIFSGRIIDAPEVVIENLKAQGFTVTESGHNCWGIAGSQLVA